MSFSRQLLSPKILLISKKLLILETQRYDYFPVFPILQVLLENMYSRPVLYMFSAPPNPI